MRLRMRDEERRNISLLERNIYDSHFVFPMVNEFSYQFGYFVINLERVFDFEWTEKALSICAQRGCFPLNQHKLTHLSNDSKAVAFRHLFNRWGKKATCSCPNWIVHNSKRLIHRLTLVHFYFGVVCKSNELNFMTNATRLRKYPYFVSIINALVCGARWNDWSRCERVFQLEQWLHQLIDLKNNLRLWPSWTVFIIRKCSTRATQTHLTPINK